MSRGALRLSAFLLVSAALPAPAQQLFNVPVRINMGGAQVTDSFGRVWLADGPGGGDPLNIRPDDAGGANWIENFSLAAFQAQTDSMVNLGFDPGNAGDVYLFNTIRWDDGVAGPDFLLEIPVPEGEYTVNLYFNEGCCVARHFKIEIEGTIVDDDVSYLDYDPVTPAVGRVGRLTFDAVKVADGVLSIGFLPCPECPDVLDTNAIVDAIEVLGGPVVVEPKFHRGDADSNGQLQLTDAVRILNVLFLGTGVIGCPDAADADDNGQLQLTDAVRILNVLFLGTGVIPAPGPTSEACGKDPTPDALEDCVYPPCP